MQDSYSEKMIGSHLVGIERLEKQRWRVSIDGRSLFTFCSESRASDAGRLEARRLDFVAQEAAADRLHRAPARRER
jgi:hypothetical protein